MCRLFVSISTSWIGRDNVAEQLQPSLFDFRLALPGLPAMRTEREGTSTHAHGALLSSMS